MNREIMSIFISPSKGEPMQSVSEVRAITGVGLDGDRYANGLGAYSGVGIPDTHRAVTLISSHAITEANGKLVRAGVFPFSPEETRRNIVLDIDPQELNSLAGKTFFIEGVELEGVELCDPCRRPTAILERGSRAGIAFEKAFEQRGGLRAKIIKGGTIKVGDNLLFSGH